MKISQTFATIIVLLAFFALDYFLLRTETEYGTKVDLIVSKNDSVVIEGSNAANVVASDDEYFRIYAGEDRLLAVPDSNDLFSASSSSFSTQDWIIKDGSQVEVTLTSESYIVVTHAPATETRITTTCLLLLVFALFWLLIMLITD